MEKKQKLVKRKEVKNKTTGYVKKRKWRKTKEIVYKNEDQQGIIQNQKKKKGKKKEEKEIEDGKRKSILRKN